LRTAIMSKAQSPMSKVGKGREARGVGCRGGTPNHKRFYAARKLVTRQYAARKWAIVRVLPDIAGYCRVVEPREKIIAEMTLALIPAFSPRRRRRLLPRVELAPGHGRVPACARSRAAGSYRFVPPGTAWYRINFFLCTQAEPAPYMRKEGTRRGARGTSGTDQHRLNNEVTKQPRGVRRGAMFRVPIARRRSQGIGAAMPYLLEGGGFGG
jgi:hypothetical protein